MNSRRASPAPSALESTAAAGVLAVVAGLILSHAARRGLEGAAPVWLAFAVLMGLVLGTPVRAPVKSAVTQALLPSALLPITYAGVWLVRFLRDWSKNPESVPSFGPHIAGRHLDTTLPLVQALLLAFLLLLFLATLLVVVLASIGKRPIVEALVRANKLGPEGIKRIQRIVIAVAGLLAVLATLWSTA